MKVEDTLDVILSECCKHYNTSQNYLHEKARKKKAVDVKRAYCYLCTRMQLGYSLAKMGSKVKIDHSTFIYHLRIARDRIKIYKNYAAQLDYLEYVCRNEIKKTAGENPYLSAMNNLGRAYLLNIEVNC